MKTLLFLSILFLAFFPVQGEWLAKPLPELRENDWFDLVCTQPYPFSSTAALESAQKNENIVRLTLRAQVIKTSKRNIEIAFQLKHLYFNFISTMEKLPVQYYYDTYFSEDSASAPSPLFTLNIPLKTKRGQQISYSLDNSDLLFPYKIIPIGLRSPGYYTEVSSAEQVNLEQLIKRVLIPFFENHPPHPSYACHISQASFGISNNTQITYIPSHSLTTDNAFIKTRNNLKYPLELRENHGYHVEFPLTSPQSVWLANKIELKLTPGDSVVIRQTGEKSYSFTGKGGGNCQFFYELGKHYLFFSYNMQYSLQVQSPEEVEKKILKGKKIYSQLFQLHGQNMNPYWKKSAQLSADYWEIAVRLRIYHIIHRKSTKPYPIEKYDIPWHTAPFHTITPFTDYLYQPENYPEFLDTYFQYKAQQLDADNLTHKSYWGKNTEAYYLKKQIFSGYPKCYMLADNLKSMIEDNHLSQLIREHNDFLSLCRDPQLRNEIESYWQKYMQIEPGQNIKNLDWDILKLIPLKKKANGYIFLTVTDIFGFPDDFKTNATIDQILSELNIKDKTTLLHFRPESRRQFLPDSLKDKQIYTFLPDSIIYHDQSILELSPWGSILMRNDGTILSRTINKSVFGINSLKTELEKAIRQPKAEKKYSKSQVAGFLLSFLIVFIASFGVVWIRIKRMRLLRKYAELELKAIRSQMNPHFIFNALGSIQSLILQGKNDRANRYLTDFSRLLRTVLSNSEKQLVSLADEINLLQLYLQLEQLRISFEYEFIIADNISPDTEEIPGMLLQPLVENAVIHGIVPQGGGKISIHFYMKENILYCEITDNGRGLQTPSQLTEQRHHFGLRGVRERLKLLNTTCHTQVELHIQDRQQTEGVTGCRITVAIPV